METTQLYRKKPVVIEAMLFTMESKQLVHNWSREQQMNIEPSFDDNKNPVLIIPTLEGDMVCSLGDYLIKEPFPTDWRKFYPCKPDMFLKTYEPLPKEDVVSAQEVKQKIKVAAHDYSFVHGMETICSEKNRQAFKDGGEYVLRLLIKEEYRNQPKEDRLQKAVENEEKIKNKIGFQFQFYTHSGLSMEEAVDNVYKIFLQILTQI